MTKVAILGGGIGGLSAAHELRERGFEVDVYEKNEICGGKARSLERPLTGNVNLPAAGPPPPGLPGEHGFRFFPGFYQHLDHTMKRIPLGPLDEIFQTPAGPSSTTDFSPTAFDNLVDAGMFAIAQEGAELYELVTTNPHTPEQWVTALSSFFDNPGLGLAAGEKEILLKLVLRLFAMCPERREKEYESMTWWKYHNEPNERSDQYNKMFVTGFSRAFVAMDARKASTMTGANTLSQFFRVFFGKGTMDRVLNAPTNDAWLSPWVDYLKRIGVTFHQNRTLTGLNVSTGPGPKKITSATIYNSETDSTTPVTADYYVAAVPVEVMTQLAQNNPALIDQSAAPELDAIANIEVSWMTGIMFYLNQDVPIVHGHINFADSNWALTGISQPQFWPNDQLANYDDGTYQGLLSIVISNWEEAGDKPLDPPILGHPGRKAEECTSAEEVAAQTWAQIVPHLTPVVPSLPQTTPEFFLDPAIKFPPQEGPPTNDERFLTNMAGTLQYRPPAATGIENLMLASDYVRTNVDVATMEGANEAGRRAANAIITESQSGDPLCGVWPYPEPKTFYVSQKLDKVLLDAGFPDAPSWGGILFP